MIAAAWAATCLTGAGLAYLAFRISESIARTLEEAVDPLAEWELDDLEVWQ